MNVEYFKIMAGLSLDYIKTVMGGMKMKKVLALLTVLVLMLACTAAIGENMAAKYEELVAGKWKAMGYAGVTDRTSSTVLLKRMEYFEFPYGTGSWKSSSSGSSESVSSYGYLTGDETGRVDMTLFFDSDILIGRVSLSADGYFMNIETTDGATFFFSKQN